MELLVALLLLCNYATTTAPLTMNPALCAQQAVKCWKENHSYPNSTVPPMCLDKINAYNTTVVKK